LNSDLVSIVIPCRNASSFLNECLDSILAQTYTHWEVIFCNDHSQDDSLKIAQCYAEKDSRFLWVNNNGYGIIDALNTAYKSTNGNFITRMDADDKMHPQKIFELITLLKQQSKESVATGKVQYFADENVQQGYKNYENWLNQLIDLDNHWEEIYKECVIPSPCWMMKRTVFEKIGGFKGNIYPEDYDLVWRMFLHQLKVVSSNQILHFWRDHAQRASRNLEVYKAQTYFELKVGYMLQTEKLNEAAIILWGAGGKGKALAKVLILHQLNFVWYSNNLKKIGVNIYGKIIENAENIKAPLSKTKILIAVSNLTEQHQICDFLNELGYQKSKNYFILA